MATGGMAERRSRPWWPPALSLPRPPLAPLAAAVPALVILGLLAVVFVVSFRRSLLDGSFTTLHYIELRDPFTLAVIENTMGFALVVVLVAFAFGVPMAWLVERTDLRGKRFIYAAMTIGVLIPGYFTAMGWLFLLHPRIGMLNQWGEALLRRDTPLANVATVQGMGCVQGLGLAGLVFVMTATSLRATDAALEEAALMSGAGFLAAMRRVTLPLMRPALLAAGLFAFVIALSVFDVPLVIGLSNRVYVFSTFIYTKVNPTAGLPNYGLSGSIASLMILFSLGLSTVYSRVLVQARRYQVITGKGYRPRQVRLGAWAFGAWAFVSAWLVLAEVLPLATLVWTSFQPYLALPSADALRSLSTRNYEAMPIDFLQRGLAHTLVLTVAVPTLAVCMSLLFSWVILRTRNRFRLVYDFVAFLPFAVPSVIFGYAAITVALFVLPPSIGLYGSLLLLVVVMALVQLSFGTRMTNGALIQISNELEEAGYASGAATPAVLRRVTLPLLKPTLVFTWIWLAMLAFRELTLPTILFSPDNLTLSVVIWSRFSTGFIGQASAITVTMMVLLVPLIAVYWRFGGGRLAI